MKPEFSNRNPHATKRGPGRKHKSGMYRGGKPGVIRYADALMGAAAAKRAEALTKNSKGPRDANGAVTFVGRETEFLDCKPDGGVGGRWYELSRESAPAYTVIFARRIWLAGISAQRGF